MHLLNWRDTHKFSKDDLKILSEMQKVRKIVEKLHNLRDQNQIKVRQVLSSASYNIEGGELQEAYLDIISEEVNVKEVKFDKNLAIGEVYLNTEITQELKNEGDLRELVRNINALRKQANLTIKDTSIVSLKILNNNFVQSIKKNIQSLKKDVLAKDIIFESIDTPIIEKKVKVNEFEVEISLK